MKLHDAYQEVKKRIDRMDFSSLWKGFYPLKFALYNETECFFDGRYVDKTADFMANTSIEYDGEHIAIWDFSRGTGDLDLLAASIVHEMFHAFQNIQGESRWADERAALFDYRYSAENISLKLHEAALMQDILTDGDPSAFAELLRLRRMRAERYPREYDYEARVEQIEGSANYVELNALTQAAPEKGAFRRQKMLAKISDPEAYTPIRVVSYYVGAAFLECIKRCSALPCEDFGPVPFAQEIIRETAPAQQIYPLLPAAEKNIAAFLDETDRIVHAALSGNDVVLRGAYRLCSLNVWDARWDGRYAISNGFVAWYDGTEKKVLNGDFVVEMGRDCIIRTVYRQPTGQ